MKLASYILVAALAMIGQASAAQYASGYLYDRGMKPKAIALHERVTSEVKKADRVRKNDVVGWCSNVVNGYRYGRCGRDPDAFIRLMLRRDTNDGDSGGDGE